MTVQSGQIGTIVELDPIDALGWIALDAGGRVRFGGTSLKGFTTNPGVGSRVEVRGTAPGYKGVPKATLVIPLHVPGEPGGAPRSAEVQPYVAEVPWPDFVRAYPRWSDAADTCAPSARPAPRPSLAPHPLFAPWHREIGDTAPTCVPLAVPDHLRPQAIEPAAGDSFAHGRVAFLEEPRWPSCGACSRPLRMCVQISPAALRDFIPGGRGLVALFCFECGVRSPRDPRVGHVRLVEPRHRVVGPDAWPSEPERFLYSSSQRVTPQAPVAMRPGSLWLRCRSTVTPTTAASALVGFAPVSLAGPLPAGAEAADLDDLADAYDAWLEAQPGAGWGDSYLGGVAHWDQADETPSCPHGEMLHLLDYNGGQFLDGALHVFSCRARACDLSFVAEF